MRCCCETVLIELFDGFIEIDEKLRLLGIDHLIELFSGVLVLFLVEFGQ